MGKIWEFFEHLDEYVYVSDPETNQLVYESKSFEELWLSE